VLAVLLPALVLIAQREEPRGPVQLEALKLPAGFSVALYADNVPGARSMALGPDGTVFVGTRTNPGEVMAVVNRNGDQRADEVVTLVEGLNTPNGVAFRDGSLFVAEVSRILRYDGVMDYVRAPQASRKPLTPVVLIDSLPTDRLHGWKYLAFGPDGLLYFQVGAPCNICERADPYASVVRMKPDGSGFEVFARGVRNSVGLDWHPETRALWFTDNGRDMLGDEVPNDELNSADRAGLHFGYPYCHEGSVLDPEFGAKRSCGDYAAPAQKLGPHVAALGLKFYTGSMFPAEYRNRLFIAQHGSWNRTPEAGPIGYRIMTARVEGGKVAAYEPFAEGWLQNRRAWGRPVDILQMPDGALLVSDDTAGVIYRISYVGK
jgi:glucose/arabinose dehydrogenase